MPRTTSELVGGIIDVDASIDLTPFIETANELVTEVCGDAGYDDVRLEKIERFLAAHFYTLRDPRPVLEKAGPVGATYQSKVDLFLSTSHYGQTAMVLDTAGGLKALNTQKTQRTLSIHWLGGENSTSETI